MRNIDLIQRLARLDPDLPVVDADGNDIVDATASTYDDAQGKEHPAVVIEAMEF